MTLFCPKCGAKNTPLYSSLCAGCYKASRKFSKTPANLLLKRCRRCSALLVKKAWLDNTSSTLKKIIRGVVKTDLHNPSIEMEHYADKAVITITGTADSEGTLPITEQKTIALEFEDHVCEACSKHSAGQYEAEIQLRHAEPHDPERFKNLASAIKKTTHHLQQREADQKAKAFWWEEDRNGISFYYGYRETALKVLNSSRLRNVPRHAAHQFLGFDRRQKKKTRSTYCIRA